VDEFERDLTDNTKAIEAARQSLLKRLRLLTDEDLQRGRRGGWSIQKVLRHVIDAEIAYTKVIAHLRGLSLQVPDATPDDVASMSSVVDALERYRALLTSAVAGVDESTFYEMRTLGREQYSVVSVLENVASHDHEHLEQIVKTVAPVAES
jgi:uncharacterized damage-inducible protein DinB